MSGSVLEQNAEEGGEVPISDLNTNTMAAAAPRVWANYSCEEEGREKVGRPATMSA